MNRILLVLSLVFIICACNSTTDKSILEFDGIVVLHKGGRAEIIQTGAGRTFRIKWSNGRPKIASDLEQSQNDSCLVRIVDAHVVGSEIEPSILLVNNFRETKRYTKSELPKIINKLGIEALNEPRVCPSE